MQGKFKQVVITCDGRNMGERLVWRRGVCNQKVYPLKTKVSK